MRLLPDALRDALAMVIAEKESEFAKMLEARDALHRASLAELKLEVANERLHERERVDCMVRLLEEYEERINARIETLKDGKDGAPGRDGAPGEKGDKGDAGEKGEQGDQGEPGQNGLDGRDGKDGAPGRDGLDGTPGQNGLDGKDGKDGRDGKDGADVIGFDSWDVEVDGRTVTFVCGRGDRQHRKSVRFDVMLYRGVYAPGDYLKGDVVTYQGSAWVALVDTNKAPGSSSWALAVKRGQHGLDGKPGAPGKEGPPGRPGLDLTTTPTVQGGQVWR